MGFILALFLATLVAGTIGAPYQSSGSPSKCSSECSSNIPLDKFVPRTLHYDYEGTSLITTGSSQKTEMKLTAQIELSYITPCDGILVIRDPKVMGQADPIMVEMMTKQPIMFAMSGNLVTKVCADPGEGPVSLNFKKGIISSIQSSLPHSSTIYSGKILTETDVLGTCQTLYNVKKEGSRQLISKFKDHSKCTGIPQLRQQQMMSSPIFDFPVTDSNSTCHQILTTKRNRFGKEMQEMTSVKCEDINVIFPRKGVIARQTSALTLKSETPLVMPTVSSQMRDTNLTFELIRQPKESKFIQLAEKELSYVCSMMKTGVNLESARIFSKLVEFLYRVPEHAIEPILVDIRAGKLCREHKDMLERYYLDALAIVSNAGAVKVMVNEILTEKLGKARTFMYALTLQTMKKPCIHVIENLRPLFESKKAPSSILLAAGSIVRRYCSENEGKCEYKPQIKVLLDEIRQRISVCSSQNREEVKEAALLLKTLGNMGIMDEKLREEVIHCILSKSATNFVRVSATQAFRQSTCSRKTTEELVKAAIGKTVQDSEIRMSAYLAAIPCADYPQVNEIYDAIIKEPSTQVRSFVLSHMRNLQESEAPWKQGLHYNLSSLVIPPNYGDAMLMHSKNYDLSYFMQTLSLGAGIETDVMFKGSFIPRMIKSNMTVQIFGRVLNIAELGLRIEDLEALVRLIASPDGYLRDTSLQKLVKDAAKVLGNIVKKSKYHFNEGSGYENSIDLSSIPKIMEMLGTNGNKQFKMDFFTRMFGQEYMFNSINGIMEEDIDQLIEEFFAAVAKQIMQLAHGNLRAYGGTQMVSETLFPTSQGIPLQLKYVISLVAEVKAKTDMSTKESTVSLEGGLSEHSNIFIGYSLGAKVGMRGNGSFVTKQGIEAKASMTNSKMQIKLDIPEKKATATGKGKIYLFTKLPGSSDVIVYPTANYPISRVQGCVPDVYQVGMETCYNVSYPRDISSSSQGIFGEYEGKITIQKKNLKEAIVALEGSYVNQGQKRTMSVKLMTPGAPSPVIGEIEGELLKMDQVKSLLLVAKRHGSARSLKLDLERKQSHQGQVYEMALFSAKQPIPSKQDMVIHMKMGGGRSQQSYSSLFELKTMNGLSPYIKSNIEMEASVKMGEAERPSVESITINKYEVLLVAAEKYKLEQYIRSKSPGSKSAYQFASKLTKVPTGKILLIEGSAESQGLFRDQTLQGGMDISVETKSTSFKTNADLSYTKLKKEILLDVKKNSESQLQIRALLSKKTPSSDAYQTIVELAVPKSRINYKLEGSIERQQKGGYEVDMKASSHQATIYMIKGPVLLKRSEGILTEKTDLTLTMEREGEEYKVNSELYISPEKKSSLLEVGSKHGKLFKWRSAMKNEGGSCKSQYNLYISEIIESNLDAHMSPSSLVISKNTLLFPKTENSRRIKSTHRIDFNEPKRNETLSIRIKSQMLLNADKDRSNKLELLAHCSYDRHRAAGLLRGDVNIREKSYQYLLGASLGSLMRKAESPNHLIISVINPEHEELKIESSMKGTYINRDLTSVNEVEYDLLLQTFSRKRYSLSTVLKNNYRAKPFTFALESAVEVKAPMLKGIKTVIDINIEKMRQNTKFHGMISADGASLEEPLASRVEYTSSESECQGNALVKLGGEHLCEVRFTKGPSKNLQASIKLSPRNREQYTLSAESSETKLFDVSLKKSGRMILESYFYKQPESWTLVLAVPSRSIEVHSRGNSESRRVSVYTGGRYEGKERLSSVQSVEMSSNTNSNMHMIADLSLQSRESSAQGSVVFDIFKNPQDKIMADVTMEKLQRGNYKLEAALKTSGRKSNLKVVTDMSMTKLVKEVELKLYPSHSTSPSNSVSFKYMATSPRTATIYFLLSMPSDHFEFVGEHKLQQDGICFGHSMNGTVSSERYGSYDVVSSVCRPSYIEVGMKKPSQDSIYLAKIGMKDPSALKIELNEVFFNVSRSLSVYRHELEPTYSLSGQKGWVLKHKIIDIGMELWSSRWIVFRSEIDVAKLKKVEREVKDGLRTAMRISSEIGQRLPKGLLKEILPESFEFAPLLEELRSEALVLWRDFKKQIEDSGVIEELIELVSMAVHEFHKLVKYVEEIVHKVDSWLKKYIGKSLEEIKQIIRDVESEFRRIIKELLRDIENEIEKILENPESLKHHKLVKYVRKQLVGSSVWNWFKHIWHSMEHKIHEITKDIEHFYYHLFNKFTDMLRSIVDYLKEYHFIDRIIDWINKWLNPDELHESNFVIQLLMKKVLGVYITSEQLYLSVAVPVKSAVSSLRAALPNIGLAKYRYAPHTSSGYIPTYESVYRPSSKSATVSEDKVVTFDGLVFPFLHSHCQILLSEAGGVKVLLKKPTGVEAELVIEDELGQQVKMEMSRGQSVRVPLLKEKKILERKSIKVQRISQKEVKIATELFQMRVTDRSVRVEAKPWAFNQVLGLLGSHDNEVSNDYPRGSQVAYQPYSAEGIHHLSKESSRRLFLSYRQEKNCPIPMH